MKQLGRFGRCARLGWLGCMLTGLQAADFAVTSPGFFTINGVDNNPTLTLERGRTYTFALNTTPGFHPFFIGTALGSGVAPAGVSGNNNNSSGTITFAVPTNAPDCVYYCTIHFFSGTIQMVDPPPPPPTVRIVGISVSTNIVLTSTGTNTWSVLPEFNTNLVTTNWFALTVQTNKFANGTNETICGKPPGDAVLIRIRSQPK